ncbi:MAG: SHOCT domain-containing protein [Acidimicrobiia bacterium]|nr:SHOCT domain-containing protein [Acidimicrobiia bacterium]
MDGWGGGWMWLWGTLMMFSWVAIIAAAIWLVTRARDRTVSPGSARAREILDERYARGELTTDEYRERLDHLG